MTPVKGSFISPKGVKTPRLRSVIHIRTDSVGGGCQVHVTPFIGMSSICWETKLRTKGLTNAQDIGAIQAEAGS